MPTHESSITMDTKVIYNKGGKKNGFHRDVFATPPGDLEDTNDYSDEDEIYVESPNLDLSDTKPLMYPRTRTKVKGRASQLRCRPIVHAVVCFLFLVLSLGSLMGLVVYFVNKHSGHQGGPAKNTNAASKNTNFRYSKPEVDYSDIIGCDHVEVEDVWVVGIPKLLTESAFRLVDVNSDGTLDAIMGFATGADGYGIPSIVCDIYFEGAYPCFGGVLALDGNTGEELWRHYSEHEIYGLNCNADFNRDGVFDCLAGGRAGAFQAVSGKDGSLIWNFGKQEAKNEIMNLYTAQLLPDIDGDGVLDILAVHGGDPLQEPGSAHRLSGRILIMSGKTGVVLNWAGVPDGRESYYSPQTYTLPDGTVMVLFGTGGETHGGSLWKIRLSDLIQGDMAQMGNAQRIAVEDGLLDILIGDMTQMERTHGGSLWKTRLLDLIQGDMAPAQAIVTDKFKGFMTPPVIADVTGDGIEDIIIPAFNSSMLAFDGLTSNLIWNHTFPGSESYNTPSPGYYNDDDVPDFLIKNAYGPGFPVYYHSETNVLDGRTGRSLIDPPIRDTVGAQASGLTVSMEGRGNDLFLYWAADCQQHTGEGGQFKFVDGTNVHEQSRSDFCRLRFKTKGYSKVYAINSHIPSPGATVYYSEDRTEVEHSKWVNTTQEGLQFVIAHPEYIDEYQSWNFRQEPEVDKGATDPSQFDSVPLYSKERPESLFETPVLDSVQRTSYKKGPIGGPFKPTFLNEGLKGRGNIQAGYDYADPYYQEPFENYANSAFNTGRKSGDRRYGYNGRRLDDRPLYPTTPGYKYSRTRYGNRNGYPGRRRGDRIRERNTDAINDEHKDRIVTTSVKPIAMKKRKKRSELFVYNNFRDVISKTKGQYDRDSASSGHTLSKSRFNSRSHSQSRSRRHVGPHDEDGLQRLLSTGTLAPPTLARSHPNYNHSIDFLFATYWFFPAKTRAILPEDQKCIEKKMAEETIRFDTSSEYYGMDHDAYEHAITDECLSHRDLPSHGTFESQTKYNPFNVHMGQMTVYRVRLTCTCTNITTSASGSQKTCANVLPFNKQQWTGYMGNTADSHWRPRTV